MPMPELILLSDSKPVLRCPLHGQAVSLGLLEIGLCLGCQGQAVGFGHTNIPPIIEALRSIGYNGYLSAEVLPLPDSTAS